MTITFDGPHETFQGEGTPLSLYIGGVDVVRALQPLQFGSPVIVDVQGFHTYRGRTLVPKPGTPAYAEEVNGWSQLLLDDVDILFGIVGGFDGTHMRLTVTDELPRRLRWGK